MVSGDPVHPDDCPTRSTASSPTTLPQRGRSVTGSGRARIGRNRQGADTATDELQIRMVEPVGKQHFQVQLAAYPTHSPLPRQHGMPREYLHAVEPVVLPDLKPSGVTFGLNPTDDT